MTLAEAARAMLTAVTYTAPPKDFGTPEEPNLCFEARIPVEFVQALRSALEADDDPDTTGWADLTADEQLCLATAIAAHVGYRLVPDDDDYDEPSIEDRVAALESAASEAGWINTGWLPPPPQKDTRP